MKNRVDDILEKLDGCINGIHRVEMLSQKTDLRVSKNADDIAEHIRRTNLLEQKLTKIYQASLVGVGVFIAHYGPDIIKILGAL